MEIKPNEVYTSREAQSILKVSTSTIKRLLKQNIIRANKLGGQYRILGKELLRVVSPSIERAAVRKYKAIKTIAKSKLKKW